MHVPGEPYTPLVLQLPEPLVINTAVIRLDYNGEVMQIWKEDSLFQGMNTPFSPGEYNADTIWKIVLHPATWTLFLKQSTY